MKRKGEHIKKRINQAIAPGIDDDHELNQDATEEEVEAGDYTEVTKLSFDEVDPS